MTHIDNQLLILTPVFNDWDSVTSLLDEIDGVLSPEELPAEVLLVDDGSVAAVPEALRSKQLKWIREVDILHLRRNVGHQRAIAIGLAFIDATRRPGTVVVMDGDGEDQPVDIPRLVAKLSLEGGDKIVFAERTRRSEGFWFSVCYRLYRMLHRALVGIPVRVGNFSAVPSSALATLVVVAELWNHYAAAIVKARIPHAMVPTERGSRLTGRSSMNWSALVIHGLSALAVFGDVVALRLLCAAGGVMMLLLLALFATLAVRLFSSLAIPGWATYTTGMLLLLLNQMAMMSFLLVFVVLSSRAALTFIPARDYKLFVKGVTRVANGE
jgi:cellulose synthase/poly-beta-1,6-N-acetylglucosamine synthase-like glycosyltransferase